MASSNTTATITNDIDITSLLSPNAATKLVMPGDCLVRHQPNTIASSGTYLKNGFIYASLAGKLCVEEEEETVNDSMMTDDNGSGTTTATNGDVAANSKSSSSTSSTSRTITKYIITVQRPEARKVPFLEPGSIVTARVLRTTSSFVKCSIHCIDNHTLKQPYTGMIRSDDIRDYDREKVHISKCYRPGDVILAKVFAPGENHQFLLTTAAPNLGVVIATNDWAEPMIPISSTEMLCPRTYTKEPRKVAQIDLYTANSGVMTPAATTSSSSTSSSVVTTTK